MFCTLFSEIKTTLNKNSIYDVIVENVIVMS